MRGKKLFKKYGFIFSGAFIASFILLTTFSKLAFSTIPVSIFIALFVTIIFEVYKFTK